MVRKNNLKPGMFIFFAAVAFVVFLAGLQIAEAQFQQTYPCPPPEPVLFVTGTGNAKVSLQANLGQSQGQGACTLTGFNIYKATKTSGVCGSFSYEKAIDTSGSYTITGLTNGVTYCFKALTVSQDSGGAIRYSTSYSNTVEGTPQKTVTSAPQNLQIQAGDGWIYLSWQAPADDGGDAVSYYKIYRGTSSGALSFFSDTCSPSAIPCVPAGIKLNFNDTSATNGITYYYAVIAVNSAGDSPQSSEKSAIPASSSVTTSSSTTTTLQDSIPPSVLSANLANNSQNISVGLGKILFNFSEAIDSATDTAITISPQKTFSKSWTADTKNLTLTFQGNLSYSTNYTITIGTGLKDLAGNSLSAPYVLFFSTENLPELTGPSSTTTTTTVASTTTSTTESESSTTTTTVLPLEAVSAQEALQAIQEAKSTIDSSQGKKNTTDAVEFYNKATTAYNGQNYTDAKALALQVSSSIKDFPTMQEIPYSLVIVAALVLILLASAVIYLKKRSESAKAKPQAEEETSENETEPEENKENAPA